MDVLVALIGGFIAGVVALTVGVVILGTWIHKDEPRL